MKENITAVCISSLEEPWGISEIPFYCHTEGYIAYPHYPPQKTRERIQYLARRRNRAHQRALDLYPGTQHFLNIDSYYLRYIKEIRLLIEEYERYNGACILGGTNWFLDPSTIPARIRYWDTWATPEMKERGYYDRPSFPELPAGWQQVNACGGFAIYPRWVWEEWGYGIPEPFPQAGNEVNYFCRCPGVSSYVTFNVKVLRETPKEFMSRSLLRRVRSSLKIKELLGITPR